MRYRYIIEMALIYTDDWAAVEWTNDFDTALNEAREIIDDGNRGRIYDTIEDRLIEF